MFTTTDLWLQAYDRGQIAPLPNYGEESMQIETNEQRAQKELALRNEAGIIELQKIVNATIEAQDDLLPCDESAGKRIIAGGQGVDLQFVNSLQHFTVTILVRTTYTTTILFHTHKGATTLATITIEQPANLLRWAHSANPMQRVKLHADLRQAFETLRAHFTNNVAL